MKSRPFLRSLGTTYAALTRRHERLRIRYVLCIFGGHSDGDHTLTCCATFGMLEYVSITAVRAVRLLRRRDGRCCLWLSLLGKGEETFLRASTFWSCFKEETFAGLKAVQLVLLHERAR